MAAAAESAENLPRIESKQEFNADLVARKVHLSLEGYIEVFAARFYPILDMEFAKGLADQCSKNECCIPHHLLVEYGVLAEKNASSKTLAMLNQYDLLEGSDYVQLVRDESKLGRGRPKKDYLLHPEAFEFCLMRAKNTKRYAMYYLLLRRCIEAYKEYQRGTELHIVSGEVERLQLEEKKTAIELAKLRADAEGASTLLHRREPSSSGVGCVYFIECSAVGRTKIGYTGNLPKRIEKLQTGCPFPLETYRSFICLNPPEYEARAHEHFADRRHNGEWFEVSREAIDAFIAGLEL